MTLSKAEYKQFLDIHPAILHYVGVQEGLLPKKMSLARFMLSSVERKMPVRNRLYEKPEYLDRILRDNPFRWSPEKLAIVREFKHFKKDRFYVMKYLKNYAVFLDSEYAYGVLALGNRFERLIGDNLPTLVDAVLLPFKGKIVYDGFMMGYRVSFGGGISGSLSAEYAKAKALYGIIESLPIDKALESKQVSNAELLEAYMKSEKSRSRFAPEIDALLDSDPEMDPVYRRLWGKINSRRAKHDLQDLGIENRYYAIADSVIVASAPTKKELDRELDKLLPPRYRQAVHVFKV